MKKIIGKIVSFLLIYQKWGIMGFVSMVRPCYFTQDVNMRNGGFDLITLKPTGQSYYRGTWWTNEYMVSRRYHAKNT